MYKVAQKSKVFKHFRSSDEDYVTITWERNVHIKRKSKNKLERIRSELDLIFFVIQWIGIKYEQID